MFCGHCDRKDCGRHYRNKEKYLWRYYKGYGTWGLRGHGTCCDYESPDETKKIVGKHLKMVKADKTIKALEDKIKVLEEHKEKI